MWKEVLSLKRDWMIYSIRRYVDDLIFVLPVLPLACRDSFTIPFSFCFEYSIQVRVALNLIKPPKRSLKEKLKDKGNTI